MKQRFNFMICQTPQTIMLTIPSGYNTRLLVEYDRSKFFYIDPLIHKLGKIECPLGHKITVYDKERTICDFIKKKGDLDTDLVIDAIKRYMRTSGSNFDKLMEYAETLKIKVLVRSYFEVLT